MNEKIELVKAFVAAHKRELVIGAAIVVGGTVGLVLAKVLSNGATENVVENVVDGVVELGQLE